MKYKYYNYICSGINKQTFKTHTMNTQILNTEKLEATENSMMTNVITLSGIPSMKEQDELFCNGSIVLEF